MTTSPQNTQKQNLKILQNRQREQHPTLLSKRSTSHLYQGSITQQKHWQSQNAFSIKQTSQTSQTTRTSTQFYLPTQGGTPSLFGLLTQKTINTSHLLHLHLQ